MQPECGLLRLGRHLLERFSRAQIFIFVAGIADEGEVVVGRVPTCPTREVQPCRDPATALARAGEPARSRRRDGQPATLRSEEHTSELQSLMRISYAVFCLNKNKSKRAH